MPISFDSMFSSLCVTMMSVPIISAEVLRPRLLTFQCHTGSPFAILIACMAPSLPPEKNSRVPFTSAT